MRIFSREKPMGSIFRDRDSHELVLLDWYSKAVKINGVRVSARVSEDEARIPRGIREGIARLFLFSSVGAFKALSSIASARR
jgi:hypothetical protein